MSMAVAIIVFIIIVGGLVYLTIHNKGTTAPAADTQSGQADQNTMTNTQQPVEGVQITTLKEGTGVAAKSGDTVSMNYTGMLADGTVFDSNVDPKFNHVQPFVFTIGAGQVIKGWDIGVAGMKVGEQRKLVISPDYGYGANGYPPIIPPNATLTFTVELVAIQ